MRHRVPILPCPARAAAGVMLLVAGGLIACGGGDNSPAAAAAVPVATAPVVAEAIGVTTTTTVGTTTGMTTGMTTTRGRIRSDSTAVAVFSPTASSARNILAFSTLITRNSAQYIFSNSLQGTDATGSSTGVADQQFVFSTLDGVPSGVAFIETSFDRGLARRVWRDCTLPCAGFSMARTANGQGMAFTLDGSRLQTNALLSTVANPPMAAVVVQGSVVGEMAGAYLLPSQLPQATSGSLAPGGAAMPVRYSSTGRPGLQGAHAALYVNAGGPAGVLSSSSGEPDFKPLSGSTSAASAQLLYSFRGVTPAGVSTQPSVMVTLAQGQVVRFMATSTSGKTYTCDDTGSLFVSRCGGTLSASADGRSLQFTNFMAGPNLSAVASVSFNGVLTVSGD